MRVRITIQAACIATTSAIAWGQVVCAQSVSDLTTVDYTSKVIHTFDEDKIFRLDTVAPGAIATWADFHEGVEIFISSVGSALYDGYWIEGLATPSTKAFVVPMGDLSVFRTGQDIEGSFTYWSPYAGESNRDFSDHLQFSPNGVHSYYEIYKDGTIFGIAGQRQIELPHNAVAPRIRDDGSVTYIARVRDGVLGVFVDEEMVSPEFELEAFSQVIDTVSDDGSGYLYGISHESGGWFLKNGEPMAIDVGAPTQLERLSPDGTKHAFVYETDGLFKVVVDDDLVGQSHKSVSPVVFSRDSQHWHYFGTPQNDSEGAGVFVTSDGVIPDITDARQAVGYIVGDARPTFIAQRNGANYVLSGEEIFGPYNDPRKLSFSWNGEHFSYLTLNDEEEVTDIVVDGQARNISIEGEYLRHLVSEEGELYYSEEIGEEEVAYRNGRELVWFSDITQFALLRGIARLAVVGQKPGSEHSTLWVEGIGELFSADQITILDTGDTGLLATRVRDGGQSYLTLEDAVIGSFDQILFDGGFVADFTKANLSFFVQNGREVSEISVPLWSENIAMMASSAVDDAGSVHIQENGTSTSSERSASVNNPSPQRKYERLLRQALAEHKKEIEALRAEIVKAQETARAAADREQKTAQELALSNELVVGLRKAAETEKGIRLKLSENLQRKTRFAENQSAVVARYNKAAGTLEELIDPASPIAVQYVQNRLIELGYDPGEPDGKFGEKTRHAIYDYEYDYGLAIAEGLSLELIIFLAATDVPDRAQKGFNRAALESLGETEMRARAQTIAPLGSALNRTDFSLKELVAFIDGFENTKAHLEWDYSDYKSIEDLEVFFCFSDWHSNTDRPLFIAFRDFANEYKINQHLFEMYKIPESVWREELDRVLEEAIVATHPFLHEYNVGELNAEENWDFQAAIGNQIWPHLVQLSKDISDYLAKTTGTVLELKTVVQCI